MAAITGPFVAAMVGPGRDFLSDVHFSDFVTLTFDVLRVRDDRTIWRSCVV